MPFAYVGAAVAVAGLASNLANSGGGSTPTSGYSGTRTTSPQSSLPPVDYSQAVNSLFHMLGTDQPFFDNLAGNTMPAYQRLTNNIVNNPYAGLARWGANEAAFLGTGVNPGGSWTGGTGAPGAPGGSAAPGPGGPAALAPAPFGGTAPHGPVNMGGGAPGAAAIPGGPQTAGGGYGNMGMQGQQAPAASGPATTMAPSPFNSGPSVGGGGGPGFGPVGGLAGAELGAGRSLFGAGGSVLNTAFDPQQLLYNRMIQQTQDQSNAINSMYGLSSSPAGAGVTEQNLRNFNIDWQNQQLQREAMGIGAAGQAYSGGAALGQMGIDTVLGTTSAPYNTFNAQNQAGITALNSYLGGAQNVTAAQQGLINPYLSIAGFNVTPTTVSTSGTGTNPFATQQAIGKNIGQSLSGLSSLFGKGGSSGGGYGGTGGGYGVGRNLEFGQQSLSGYGLPQSGGYGATAGASFGY